MKNCSKCLETKPLEDFPKCKHMTSGRDSYCRKCRSVLSSADYAKNREKRLAQAKQWRQDHPEKVCEYSRRNRISPEEWEVRKAESKRRAREKYLAERTGYRSRMRMLTGQTFGILLVLQFDGKNSSGDSRWICLCRCGKLHNTAGSRLVKGVTKSCGCRGIVPFVCTKCRVQKTASEFRSDPRRMKKLRTICKACEAQRTKDWAQDHAELLASRKREKYATSPEVRKRSRERMATWKSANKDYWKECKKVQTHRARAKANGMSVEDYLARRAARIVAREKKALTPKKCERLVCPVISAAQKRAMDAEKLRQRSREYYWANLDKVRAKVKRWKKSNPAKLSRQRYRRRTNFDLNLPNDLTDDQWRAIKASYGHRCAYCGEKKPLTQDHVVPVSKGGPHTASNIVPACKSCNSAKGSRPLTKPIQMHLIA